MIVYTVHEPGIPAKSLDERADEVVFIKEGFTWWGFLFGPLWLLFNALWFEFAGAVLLAAAVNSGLTQLELKDQAEAIAYLMLMLIVGFEGNGLRRGRLERKGYVYLASVAGAAWRSASGAFSTHGFLPWPAGRRAGAHGGARQPRRAPGGIGPDRALWALSRVRFYSCHARCDHRLPVRQFAFRREGFRARGQGERDRYGNFRYLRSGHGQARGPHRAAGRRSFRRLLPGA